MFQMDLNANFLRYSC